MPRLVRSTDRYGRWDKLKIYIFVFVAGFPITIRLFFIFLGGREAGSRRPPYPHMVFVGNERTSTYRQSPGCGFQPQRHHCELTPSDFNCFAIGKKVFQQGNANCLPAWQCRAGQYTCLWSIEHHSLVSLCVLKVKTVRHHLTAEESMNQCQKILPRKLTASVVCSKTKTPAML